MMLLSLISLVLLTTTRIFALPDREEALTPT
jgi:hypothetical protein